MVQISNWLRRVSTDLVTLLGLVIFILFTTLVLPGQAPSDRVYEETGQAEENPDGAATPDLSFVYSVNELYEMAESYGVQGRRDYVKARFTFDLVWPVVYTFFLVTTISWLFEKAFPGESTWQRVNLVPTLAMALDYLENISTSIIMTRYPARTALVDSLATVFTPLKWIFVGLSFVLLLCGISLTLWNWLQRR